MLFCVLFENIHFIYLTDIKRLKKTFWLLCCALKLYTVQRLLTLQRTVFFERRFRDN